jgi:hypothetical protein
MDALTRRVYYEREKVEVDMLDFVYHEWDEKLEKEWQLANECLTHAASETQTHVPGLSSLQTEFEQTDRSTRKGLQ